jgi:hypothetical protein
MMDFEIETNGDGETVFVSYDGREIDAAIVDMIFEVHKHNPDFFEHWVELARTYIISTPEAVEA